MKYYYNYLVIYKDRNGKAGRITLRADNPEHLKIRFKEKYPSRTITKFTVQEDSWESSFLVLKGYTWLHMVTLKFWEV